MICKHFASLEKLTQQPQTLKQKQKYSEKFCKLEKKSEHSEKLSCFKLPTAKSVAIHTRLLGTLKNSKKILAVFELQIK